MKLESNRLFFFSVCTDTVLNIDTFGNCCAVVLAASWWQIANQKVKANNNVAALLTLTFLIRSFTTMYYSGVWENGT